MTKNLLLALSALACTSALAQAPIGTVVSVDGVVTATQGATGLTVTPGTPVQNGMRFVTTSRGTVTLRTASGCTVTVPPGHGVTVLQSMTCQQLTAAVQPVAPVAATGSTLGAGGGTLAIAVFGAALVAAIVQDANDDNTVVVNPTVPPLSPQ